VTDSRLSFPALADVFCLVGNIFALCCGKASRFYKDVHNFGLFSKPASDFNHYNYMKEKIKYYNSKFGDKT
jgi:hypothetical protein